ncbi:MAG: type III pantothenate kinase [candidate division WOR-3 bacterium]
MRVLVVDVGNSRIKAGLFVEFYLPEVRVIENLDELSGWADEADAIAISSVVPQITKNLEETLPSALILKEDNSGIRIFYREPARLGSDRIANALYVRHFLGQRTILADVGTAVTVDSIGEDGTFYGGVIFPGPGLALGSLGARTSALPRIDLTDEPVGPLGRDTEAGMRSGVLWSVAFAIEGFARAQANFLGWERYRLLLTGGLGKLIRPMLKARCSVETHATLLGLGAWAQELARKGELPHRDSS